MGSVQSYNECPRCETPDGLFEDFYYKTGESYQSCTVCGYTHNQFYERDSDGELILIDPSKHPDFDNLVWKVEVVEDPFGVVHIRSAKGGQMITLRNEEAYNELLKQIETLDKENLESIILTRFDGKEFITETILSHV